MRGRSRVALIPTKTYNSRMIVSATRPTDILHYGRLPWPVDWTEVYGRDAPLLLEIGFGGGQYLVDWATSRPDANLLGLEISLPALRRGARKIGAAGIDNARVLQGDSRAVLQLLFMPASAAVATPIHAVVINFPDPWPKPGHHYRRLINDDFLQLLATRMPPGALLDINTDHPDYQAAITDCLLRTPYFDSGLDVPFVTRDDARWRTKYETIALAEGRTCHYYKWVRNAQPASDRYPALKEGPMPHVVLQIPATLEAIAAAFEPWQVRDQGVVVKYLEAYQAERQAKLLIEAYVTEEPFHQRVCLEIRRRRYGDIVVNLSEVGFPRSTPGMHIAAHHLVLWLTAQYPDTTVINSTLNVTES